MGEMISHHSASLGEYGAAVETRLRELQNQRVIERVWEGGHALVEAGCRFIRFHPGEGIVGGIERLLESLS